MSMSVIVLYAATFISNAAILIFEIVGARFLASYIGTSYEVWAGLISVILGSMALGYWLAGKLADKHAKPAYISYLFILAGFAGLYLWSFRYVVPAFFATLFSGTSFTFAAIGIGIVLFAPVTILLAMISPFVVKLSVNSLASTARVVGSLNAIGTLGSIVGAVASSTILIPLFGVSSILFGTAIFVLVFSLLFSFSLFQKRALALVLPLALALSIGSIPLADERVLAEVGTTYNQIVVYASTRIVSSDTGREMLQTRSVRTDPFGVQCGMEVLPDGSMNRETILFPYVQGFDVLMRELSKSTSISDVLFLGGCVYTYPRWFLEHTENARADVVELDAGMTKVAKEYFGFDEREYPTLSLFHEDARQFLSREEAHYDIVYMDVFGSFINIPHHLTTREAFLEIQARMREGGALVINVISVREGDAARFSSSIQKTLESVFGTVSVYYIAGAPSDMAQNLLFVARDGGAPLPETLPLSPHARGSLVQVAFDTDDAILLTDEYAPVETLIRALRNS